MFRDAHHNQPCQYCLRPMNRADRKLHATRDHINPRCRGGGPIVVACITCNGIKGNMLHDVWQAFMAAHPSWWTLTKYELRMIQRAAIGLPTVPRKRAVRFVSARRLPVVVPPSLIYRASQPATERNDQ